MRAGADTDIVTGKPTAMLAGEQEALLRQKEQARLGAQTAWHGITDSQAGRKILELIEQKLMDRILQLVTADPQAATLHGLAQELGLKDDLARKASEKLTRMTCAKET